MITIGLWLATLFIRFHVWEGLPGELRWNLAAVVGACLGGPLIFCWVGGMQIWQAIRWQQAHWSGSVAAEQEWLPRQALHYSTLAFAVATFANLALFVSVAWLGLTTGLFEGALNVVGHSREGRTLLWTCFVLIGLPVSYGYWVYATRKVYNRPPLLSAFLGLLLAGLVVAWFSSAPPYSLLPATFVLTAILAGLTGGWMQVKWVKIRKLESTEPVASLALGDLFLWDRRALAITLVIVVAALGLLERLTIGNKPEMPHLLFSFMMLECALVPVFVLVLRGATGKAREFFQSMLILTSLPLAVPFLAGITDPSGFKSTRILTWLALNLASIAAGCALIYFGKIRAKVP